MFVQFRTELVDLGFNIHRESGFDCVDGDHAVKQFALATPQAGRRRWSHQLLWLLVFWMCACSASAGDLDDCQQASIESWLKKSARSGFKRSDAPGMAIAIVDKDQLVFQALFGLADRASKHALSADTPLPMGRGGQIWLSLAALKLAEQGALSLTRSVQSQWPEFDLAHAYAQAGAITPSLLLTHHAGLSQGRLHGIYRRPSDDLQSFPERFFQVRPAGQLSSYSAQSMRMLAGLLEHRIKGSLQSWIEQHIWQALDMKSSLWSPGSESARGHRDGKRLELIANEPLIFGAHASLHDLIRLAQFLLGSERSNALPLATRAKVYRRQRQLPLDLDVAYGFGMTVAVSESAEIGEVARFFLDSPGSQGELRILPKLGLAMISFSNSAESGRELAETSRELLNCVLKVRHDIAPIKIEDSLPGNIDLPEPFEPDRLADSYSTSGGIVRTEPSDDGFEFDALGLNFSARERKDGWYRIRFELFGALPLQFGFLKRVLIRPARVNHQRVLLGWFFGTRVLLGSALPESTVDDGMRALVGSWRIRNPDALIEDARIENVSVQLDDANRLSIGYEFPLVLRFRVRFPLERLDATTLVVPGLGALLGEPVYLLQSGAQTRLLFAGYELERSQKE
jgi:CubicO group peptidase (beta-lactamase class C family)